MLLETIFAPFVKERPICVMARGTVERLLDAQRLDTLFARTAQQQSPRKRMFSSVLFHRGQREQRLRDGKLATSS